MKNTFPSELGSHPDFPESTVAFDSDLGFYHTTPYPTVAALEKFYTQEYREIRQESPDGAYLKFMRHRAMEQSRFIMEASSRRNFNSVMDIGCGCGELLNALQPHSKQLHGFETDRVMAAHAIANRSANSIDIRNEHYSPAKHSLECDLITMSHVLEHIPEPLKFLANLRKKSMAAGAVIFLEVPNEPTPWVAKQIDWNIRGLGHLNYFTKDSLIKLAQDAGFEKLLIRECGPLQRRLISSRRPRSRWHRAIESRWRRFFPNPSILPNYDDTKSNEPRIWLQLVASAQCDG